MWNINAKLLHKQIKDSFVVDDSSEMQTVKHVKLNSKGFEKKVIIIQRFIRLKLFPSRSPLTIRRFKEKLSAVVKGYKVRRALR